MESNQCTPLCNSLRNSEISAYEKHDFCLLLLESSALFLNRKQRFIFTFSGSKSMIVYVLPDLLSSVRPHEGVFLHSACIKLWVFAIAITAIGG